MELFCKIFFCFRQTYIAFLKTAFVLLFRTSFKERDSVHVSVHANVLVLHSCMFCKRKKIFLKMPVDVDFRDTLNILKAIPSKCYGEVRKRKDCLAAWTILVLYCQ